MQYLFILLVNCSSEDGANRQIRLNGYWEIEFVYQNGEKFIPKVSQFNFLTIIKLNIQKVFLNKVTLELDESL